MNSIVLISPKFPANLGAIVRICSCFDIKQLRYTGNRFELGDLGKIPRELRMRTYKDVDWRRSDKPLEELQGTPVGVELLPGAIFLPCFEHPKDAIYIFGPEDGNLPQVYRRLCHSFVQIPTKHCLSLPTAVSIILYDRLLKEESASLRMQM